MLTVFYGTDEVLVRREAIAYLDRVKENASVTYIDHTSFSLSELRMITDSVSLFGEKTVIVFDTLSRDASIFDDFIKEIQSLQKSESLFIVIEGKLLTKPLSQFKKICEVREVKGLPKEKRDTFALTNAFRKRDKRMLWLLLHDAWRHGETNEAIVGLLLWQIKLIRLSLLTKNSTEAGVSEFQYKQAREAGTRFSLDELDSLSRDLLMIYHGGHAGELDLDVSLERFVLTL